MKTSLKNLIDSIWLKLTMPNPDEVRLCSPYYWKYDGTRGDCQVMNLVNEKYVGLEVPRTDGTKIIRVMRVRNRHFFNDFDCTCTEFDIERTKWVYSEGRLLVVE